MLELSKIIDKFITIEGKKFQPTEVNLVKPFLYNMKDNDDIQNIISISEKELKLNKINRKISLDKTVIAIDSTAFKLGIVQDGVIAGTRISVIKKIKNQKDYFLELYGPYIFMITNQNKQELYHNLFKIVYGKGPQEEIAPENFKMIDRIRNLLERYIQFDIIKKNNRSIILLDGSLIGNTVANPGFFIHKLIDESFRNKNELVAISKFTNLLMKNTGSSILSLCENENDPTFVGPLNNFIEGQSSRYIGDIYVAKLTYTGISFRIDVPKNSIVTFQDIVNSLSGLSGDYGYPEELKLAHSTCIFSSIEILELQAAAINKYNMNIEESLRKKIFAPF